MGSIVAPWVGLVVLLRVLLWVLDLLDDLFPGCSRPRVMAQGVTASLIDVELWGEAEGGRIKISLPLKWSFAGGSRCWGSLLHFPSQVGAVDPKSGPSTIPFAIPFDGNAFNDLLHVADLPGVARHTPAFFLFHLHPKHRPKRSYAACR